MIKPLVAKAYRRLFARPAFRSLNLFVLKLGLSGLGVLNYKNSAVSGERHFLTRVLPRHLRSARPTVVDVGANVGHYARDLLAHFPDARMHLFEPQPGNFRKLQAAGFGAHVSCHPVALGATAGTVTLYDRADSDGSEHASLHQDVIVDLHKTALASSEVGIDTLDCVAEREGLERIDLLKIDTEGHEFAVLQGAARLLAEGRIGCIHFEFNEMNVVSRVFLRDFAKLLPRHRLYRLLPAGLLPLGDKPIETELFAYQNIVALPVGDEPAR